MMSSINYLEIYILKVCIHLIQITTSTYACFTCLYLANEKLADDLYPYMV